MKNALFLGLVLAACGESKKPPMKPEVPAVPVVPNEAEKPVEKPVEPTPKVPGLERPQVQLTPEQLVCETAEDCVIVPLTCCDHCNGGVTVVVNKASEAEIAKLKPACEEVMCTQMACSPIEVQCEEKVCSRKMPSKEGLMLK